MTGTILLTGIGGYIAKHTAVALLGAGYSVRGSLRNLSRADAVRAALRPALSDPAALEKLSFVALDLTADAGWHEAMAEVTALVHMASPFPLAVPKDEAALIRPAVDGTRRALLAARAAGVTRVLLTSSIAAVGGSQTKGPRGVYDEADWTDATSPAASAYVRSKTLAERAAWDIARAEGLALTALNPGFVLGPPLDAEIGTSVAVVQRLLRGKDPMVPDISFPCVDVRDVALAHLRALERPGTAGQRLLLVDRTLSFREMGQALKAAFPARRIPTMQAPTLVIRALALVDPSIRAILPILGLREEMRNVKAVAELGLSFRDTRVSVAETAERLIALGVVR